MNGWHGAKGRTTHSLDGELLQLKAVSKSYGSVLAVDSASVALKRGQMLALLGPSGCGKTTTLRMVAGLERPTAGEIVLDGRLMADASRSVPPEHRGLGMVFQTYALWPHMTVFDNVAYGLRRTRMSKLELQKRVGEVLAAAGMSGYQDRSATQLSGGQQQRVAVARALATRPTVLLFDEPLSNLDAMLRESMRLEIRSLQQENEITAIYVTHSQEEALAMADVIAVMNNGQIQQIGEPQELYAAPKNRFVAGFVGLANVFSGTVDAVDHTDHLHVRLQNGSTVKCRPRRDVRDRVFNVGEPISLAIRPERFEIAPAADRSGLLSDDFHCTFVGTVTSTMFTGNLIDYFVEVRGLPDRLRVQSLSPAAVGNGQEVILRIAPERCIVLDD